MSVCLSIQLFFCLSVCTLSLHQTYSASFTCCISRSCTYQFSAALFYTRIYSTFKAGLLATGIFFLQSSISALYPGALCHIFTCLSFPPEEAKNRPRGSQTNPLIVSTVHSHHNHTSQSPTPSHNQPVCTLSSRVAKDPSQVQ